MFNSIVNDERIKGFQFAQQPERIERLSATEVRFTGDGVQHMLSRLNGSWACSCRSFGRIASSGYPVAYCAHVIAVEKLVDGNGVAA